MSPQQSNFLSVLNHTIRPHWAFLMLLVGPSIGLSAIYQAGVAKLLQNFQRRLHAMGLKHQITNSLSLNDSADKMVTSRVLAVAVSVLITNTVEGFVSLVMILLVIPRRCCKLQLTCNTTGRDRQCLCLSSFSYLFKPCLFVWADQHDMIRQLLMTKSNCI